MTNEKNEKDSEAKRRQTQGSSAVADGHGRAWSARRTSIGVPPRFSSQGVFSSQGTQHQAFASSDPARTRFAYPFERALPAPACPSPANFHRGLVVVLGG